jgi:hypothetical protein
MDADSAKGAVIRVGDGRGFLVEGKVDRFIIITAAHCLPSFPPCLSFSYVEERTYQSLLGTLGQERTVWAECRFVDLIADIAVLGAPDDQTLFDEWELYEELVNAVDPLPVSDAAPKGDGWLLSLEGQWFQCKIDSMYGPLDISDATGNIAGGMSGSPILSESGSAIGIVCAGGETEAGICTEGGPNSRLARNLPGWMLDELSLRLWRP